MIQVDAETAAALRADSVKVKPRIIWKQGNLGGTPENTLDLSDRMVSFPATSTSVGAFLTGARESKTTLSILNADRMFSPDVTGGYFANRTAAERLAALVTVELGVEKQDGTYGYVPVYAGYVQGMVYRPGVVDFDLASPFHLLRQYQVPEDLVIDPSWMTTLADVAPQVIRELLFNNTPISNVTGFTDLWDTLYDWHRESDWVLGGRIRAGVPISSAVEAVARSGLGVVVPHEDGRMRFISEFPRQEVSDKDRYGDLIDVTNADSWTVGESIDHAATSVAVAYNGVSVAYPTTADDAEDDLGRLRRVVMCPYLYLGRCAWTAAYILYTQAQFPLLVAWSMGLPGAVIQIGDLVRVKDPITDTERTVRIISKSWGGARVHLAGMAYGHQDSIIDETYRKWDSSGWTSSDKLL